MQCWAKKDWFISISARTSVIYSMWINMSPYRLSMILYSKPFIMCTLLCYWRNLYYVPWEQQEFTWIIITKMSDGTDNKKQFRQKHFCNIFILFKAIFSDIDIFHGQLLNYPIYRHRQLWLDVVDGCTCSCNCLSDCWYPNELGGMK